MSAEHSITGERLSTYAYDSDAPSCTDDYLIPIVKRIVEQRKPESIFDLGCGNGSVANYLSKYAPVSGVDASNSAIAIASRSFPHLKVDVGSAYDDLASKYGDFPLVVSLEVVEHLYAPRTYAENLFRLVRPGGIAVVSTPYHGYWKNLALALTGRLDTHFSALWDGGHIKFWSVRTLTVLLSEAGFANIEFQYAGRLQLLAKSMIAVARRQPEGSNL